MPQREANVVETFEQAELAKGIDLEFCGESAAIGDGLRFERDGQLIARNLLRVLEQSFDLLLRKAGKNDAIFARVGKEDVGKCRSDDHAKAVVGERPCGVLAARSAAEVFAGDEDLASFVARIVEDKIGDRLARERLSAKSRGP